MLKASPFPELNVTQAMCALVGHTRGHQMMVSQADHALKGHSVSQVPLSLTLALLGLTVKVLEEQVIKIVSYAIQDTIVPGSN